MTEENKCVFCQVVAGELPSAKIWENEDFVAFLDIKPNTKGATLVLPKKHFESYAFDIPKDVYSGLMLASREVAKILEKGLGVKRVGMIMEGMGIDHTHIKLYPMHGLNNKYEEIFFGGDKFFDKYEGYLTSELGPRADMAELQNLAEEIKNNNLTI
jgi:diadenosine tetraphosphate (Ap4A) HIT family hydrolase